jgi:hypothetical protein
MVCDEAFDPSVITAFTWPTGYPAPMQVGFASLPIVTPAPKANRDLALPPPTQLELPAKGVVPPPKAAKDIISKGVPAGGAAGGIGFWDWIRRSSVGDGRPGVRRRGCGWRRRLRTQPLAPGAP